MDTYTSLKFDHQKLQKIRKAQGITQHDAALAVGVKKQTISNFECGHGKPSADVLMRLLALYNVRDPKELAFEAA